MVENSKDEFCGVSCFMQDSFMHMVYDGGKLEENHPHISDRLTGRLMQKYDQR